MFLLIVFFGVISNSYSLININNCTTTFQMNMPGETYELTNDISINGSTCLNFVGNNMILDCKGFTLTGNQTLYHNGININNDHNNTVKNCEIEKFTSGLAITGSHNNTYENITINNSIYPGIYFWSGQSNNNIFKNISIYNTIGIGLYSNRNSTNNTYEDIYVKNFTGNNGISIYESFSIFNEITVLGTGGNSCINFVGSHNNDVRNVNVKNCSNGLSVGVWTRSTNNYFENVVTLNNANGVKISGNSTNNTLVNVISNYNSYGVYFQNDGYENNILNSDIRYNSLGNIYFFAGTPDQRDNLFQNTYLGNSSTDIIGGVSDNIFVNNYYDDFNGTNPFCFAGVCDSSAVSSDASVGSIGSVSLPSFGMWSVLVSLSGIILFLF
jgi:hypothetical protein